MHKTHIEKVLVLVKTGPKQSSKYIETVCTAGIREDGSWIRLYPISFRLYKEDQRFVKFQWIECSVYKAQNDNRPESFHLDLSSKIILRNIVDTKNNWEKRRHLLKNCPIYTKKDELIELSKNNLASLAIFHPKSCKFYYRRKSNKEIKDTGIHKIQLGLNLFDDEILESFKYVEDIPYVFYYQITDYNGVISNYQIFDWEIEALYNKYKDSGEQIAIEKVIQKYNSQFLSKDIDLHFFMGTVYLGAILNRPNPWMIIGVLPLPAKEGYQTLFDF